MRCLQTIVDDEDDEGPHVHWSKVKATYGRVAVYTSTCAPPSSLKSAIPPKPPESGWPSTSVWAPSSSLKQATPPKLPECGRLSGQPALSASSRMILLARSRRSSKSATSPICRPRRYESCCSINSGLKAPMSSKRPIKILHLSSTDSI
jgi:hypothetical protein